MLRPLSTAIIVHLHIVFLFHKKKTFHIPMSLKNLKRRAEIVNKKNRWKLANFVWMWSILTYVFLQICKHFCLWGCLRECHFHFLNIPALSCPSAFTLFGVSVLSIVCFQFSVLVKSLSLLLPLLLLAVSIHHSSLCLLVQFKAVSYRHWMRTE